MKGLFLVLMFVVGTIFGSFLCCQARRINLAGKGRKKLGRRSVCLKCGRQLKWFDNIPIFSWLILGGKCRHCGAKIGGAEILAEILVGVGMLLIGTLVPADFLWGGFEWAIFGVLILLFLMLSFVAIYDGLFGELPVFGLMIAGVLAIILAILKIILVGFSGGQLLNIGGAILILGGLYLILYLVSKGKWVGDGDWILGTILAVALGNAWLAIFVLFIANLLGCLVMYPVVRRKKEKRIYFGPFLVMAFVIVMVFGTYLLEMVGM